MKVACHFCSADIPKFITSPWSLRFVSLLMAYLYLHPGMSVEHFYFQAGVNKDGCFMVHWGGEQESKRPSLTCLNPLE